MPATASPSLSPSVAAAAPAEAASSTQTERVLAEVLAEVVRAERVPVDSHFFDDLGADSMLMAQFCARVRKRGDVPQISMKDVYGHPTIESLAAVLEETAPSSADSPAPAEAPAPAGIGAYLLAGALQVLAVLAYASGVAFAVAEAYHWASGASGLVDAYFRITLVGAAGFLGLCALPIAAKWLLVGRWRRQEIRIWSLAYVRFWIVKTLIRRSPLALFVGSPLYVLYLRALGARIGRGVVILSQHVPICTDLLTIGEGTVIRKDAYFTGYRARAGVIETGAVTLGKDVLVGEATVLDIDTSLGDGAQLGHSSALHVGQAVPAGEHRIGSPAQHRTGVDYRAVEPRRSGGVTRAAYAGLQVLAVVFFLVPAAIGGTALLIEVIPPLGALLDPEALTSWTFYRDALAASFVLFFGAALAGLVVVGTLPRLLNLALEPNRTYRLYGVHYFLHRTIARLSNATFFVYLFGDSSAIVHYLRWLGYDLSRVEQTGSNFGLELKHETPFLSSVGSGTMIADQSSMLNAEFSSTSFRVSRAAIGARNFVGNYVFYPSQGRTGDDCLLATKVMVPVEGAVREGVGLLGSPSFEIPRRVDRDTRFDHLARGEERRRRLAAKNKHNAGTIGLFLLVRWIHLFGILVLGATAVDLYPSVGAFAFGTAVVLALAWSVLYFALVESAAAGFRSLRPQYCSIYEPYFWWHERYWKLSTQPKILDGTPFKRFAWRLAGVRIGKRVFDDGAAINEKTLVAIGDDTALNLGSVIQPHSQEDGAFKSDRIEIGAGCTVGVGALVHYGVTMGDRAVLAPDSFLMKGEEMPAHARWGGNPARAMR
jgi:non-ribosomal peptide synthetase-like protein